MCNIFMSYYVNLQLNNYYGHLYPEKLIIITIRRTYFVLFDDKTHSVPNGAKLNGLDTLDPFLSFRSLNDDIKIFILYYR